MLPKFHFVSGWVYKTNKIITQLIALNIVDERLSKEQNFLRKVLGDDSLLLSSQSKNIMESSTKDLLNKHSGSQGTFSSNTTTRLKEKK